jgi:hypothetical protein
MEKLESWKRERGDRKERERQEFLLQVQVSSSSFPDQSDIIIIQVTRL